MRLGYRIVSLLLILVSLTAAVFAQNYPVILVPGHSYTNDAEKVWNDQLTRRIWSDNGYSVYTTPYDDFLCVDDSKLLGTNSLSPKTVFKISYYRTNETQVIDDIPPSTATPGYIGGIKESYPSLAFSADYGTYAGKNRVSFAERLKTLVDSVLRATGASKVNLVTYSMGGLVARSYITWFGGASKVNKLLMFAAPNNGLRLLSTELSSTLGIRTRNWQAGGEMSEMDKQNKDLTSPSSKSFIGYLEQDWPAISSPFKYAAVSAEDDGVVVVPTDIPGTQFHKTLMGVYHTDGYLQGGDNDEAIIARTTYTSDLIESWILKNNSQIPDTPPNFRSSNAPEPPSTPGFESNTFEWSLPVNTVVTRPITIFNTGEKPLVCNFDQSTFPNWVSSTLNSITIPGRSNAIWTVTINTTGLSVGEKNQLVKILTNDPISPQISKRFSVSVYLVPPTSDPGTTPPPTQTGQTLTVNNQTINSATIFSIKDYMTVYNVTISAQAAVTLAADTIVIGPNFFADSGSRLETITGSTTPSTSPGTLIISTMPNIWGNVFLTFLDTLGSSPNFIEVNYTYTIQVSGTNKPTLIKSYQVTKYGVSSPTLAISPSEIINIGSDDLKNFWQSSCTVKVSMGNLVVRYRDPKDFFTTIQKTVSPQTFGARNSIWGQQSLVLNPGSNIVTIYMSDHN